MISEAEKPAEKFEVMRQLERAGRTARPESGVTSLAQLGGNLEIWMFMGEILDVVCIYIHKFAFLHTCIVNHHTWQKKYIYNYVCMYVCMYVCIYIYIFINK